MSDDSPVEKLNESLYSRNYKPPADVRTPVRPSAVESDPPAWHDPSLDEMLTAHHLEPPHPSLAKKVFIASVIFFVLALGGAAYVFLGGSNFISSKNVDIQVAGPVTAASGDPVLLAVSIKNKNNADLTTAKLSVTYPDGTREASDTAMTLARDERDLGVIAAGQTATTNVSAAFFGETGAVEEVTLTIDYTIRGSSAVFSKVKTYDITLGDSPVQVGVSQPDSVTAGVPFATTVTVAANSSNTVKGVVLKADWPYGFKVVSSDPATSQGDNAWTLGDFAPGDKQTITIQGILSGVDQDERTFRFETGVATDSGMPNTVGVVSHTVALARPDIGVSLALNGSNAATYTAPAGGSVTTVVHYQNNSTSKLTAGKISVSLSGPFDPASVQVLGDGFYDSNTSTITWDAASVPALATLAPGDAGSFSFSFSAERSSVGSKEINLTARASGLPPGAGTNGALSSSASASVKIASKVMLAAYSLYSRGPFGNSGPIPPKAGKTTTYTVVLELGNTANDVATSTITGRLGPNVKWLDSKTSAAENVSYDQSSNTITWQVGTLSSGVGFSTPAREAAFDLSFTPSLGQVGSVPTLVSNISFSGTDSFTSTPVNLNVENVSTAITNDPAYVEGDETVVK